MAAVGTLLFTILPAVSETAARQGAADLLTSSDTLARTAQVSSPVSSDEVAAAPRIRDALQQLFPAGTVEVTSSGRSSSVPVEGTTVPGQNIVFASRPDLTGIHIVSGSWTTADARSTDAHATPTTAVQADAAQKLGLSVGDEVVAGSPGTTRTLRVVALWTASNSADPRWLGDSLAGSGTDAGDLGPFLVGPADLAILPVAITWTWSATATKEALSQPAAVTVPIASMAQVVHRGGVSSSQQVSTAGALVTTLANLRSATAAADLLISISLALIAAVLVVFAAQLGSLLSLARIAESDLLRARGASTRQFLALSLVETAAVSVPATVVALALGFLALRVLFPATPLSAGTLALTGIAVIVGLLVVVGAAAWRGVRPAHRTGSRASLITTSGLAAAAILAAGLTIWRLSTVGEPLVAAGGTATVDPLAALAPLLSAVAGGLICAVILAPASALASRLVGACIGLQPGLAARSVSRRHGVFAGPVFAVALVVAATGFVAALTPTWLHVDDLAGEVSVGASARLTSDGDTAVSPNDFAVTSNAIAGARGVRAATTVLSDSAQSGQTTVSLIGIAADRVETVTGGGQDAATLATTLAPGSLPGLELPAGSRSLDVRVTVASLSRPGAVSTLLWVGDAQGAVAELSTTNMNGSGTVASGSSAIVHADLPTGAGRWRLLAAVPSLSVEQPTIPNFDDTTESAAVTLSDLTTTTPQDSAVPTSLTASFQVAESAGGTVHSLGKPADRIVPVTITPALASSLGVGRGSRIDLDLASTSATVQARVAGIVAHVPGSGSDLAAAVDLRSLEAAAVASGTAVPNPNEVWAAAAESPRLLTELARASTVSGSITTRATSSLVPVVQPAITAFWVAAVIAGLLAVLAVGAAGVSLLLSRRVETGILRSLGVRGGAQARARAGELGAVVLLGIVGGVVVGVVTVSIAAAPFAFAAVPDLQITLSLSPTFSIASWALASAGLAVVCAVVIGAVAAAVGRRAPRARVEDDAR